MSVGDAPSSFADKTAIYRGLPPPRSLYGVEDAAIVWQTITRRFPNAAPLLCEMEAVIERAEDLLQQLRTPCASQGDDTSGSFHTPDSRESNATISMVSDIESFAEETNVLESKTIEDVEAQLKVHDIHDQRMDLEAHREYRNEQSVQCEQEYPEEGYPPEPSATLGEVVLYPKTSSTNERSDRREESKADVTDCNDKEIGSDETRVEIMAEQSSLEGWAKITNDALQEWPDDIANIETPDDNDLEARSNVDENVDNCLPTIDSTSGCDEIARSFLDINDVAVTRNNLEDGIVKSSANRSPFTILEEYAGRCRVSVKYVCRKPKPNLCVIDGDLCGFRAMSCAETLDLAKNELAARVLRLVAERQMDGTKLSSSVCGLSDLTRGEMLEILAFDKGELKNASQKVYKSCLERGEPAPEYFVRNLRTNLGFRYTAQCAALGYIGIGQGPRKDTARIAAAENLYEKYSHETEEQKA